MSILDCDEDFLESWERRLSILRHWADQDAYYSMTNPLVLRTKLYRYSENEMDWLIEHKIEYSPLEMITVLSFNPFAAGITEDLLDKMDDDDSVVLIIKPDTLTSPIVKNLRMTTWLDLKPNKLKGSPYFS